MSNWEPGLDDNWHQGRKTIYRMKDGTYGIADGYWLPGVFVDFAAAEAAFDLADVYLQRIWDAVRPRPLTFDDLRELL